VLAVGIEIKTMAQVQVITGVERRRRWSEEQKREIVEAAFAPGANVAAIARQADINNGLIYRWRQQLRQSATGFAEVVVMSGITDVTDRQSVATIEVALSNGAHARIPATIPTELAAAVIKALVRR
jgi:transposase